MNINEVAKEYIQQAMNAFSIAKEKIEKQDIDPKWKEIFKELIAFSLFYSIVKAMDKKRGEEK